MKYLLVLLLSLFFAVPAYAQELVLDEVSFIKAEVAEVIESGVRELPGLNARTPYQTITVVFQEGVRAGESVEIENDYVMLEEGDLLYVRQIRDAISGREIYSVADPYRINTLLILAALFLGALFLFGGWQGVRGLLALLASLGLISYALIPGILAGYSPVLVALGVSSIIVVVGSYVTHGFTRTTSAAVLGMIATIVVTGLLAWWATGTAMLTGYADETAVYLNFDTGGAIDFVGLLLAGLMIGLLGVLYDAAIGQAVAVEELVRAGAHYTRRNVYERAARIGREHIGALVNTLAIAYVGAALPLLLLLVNSSTHGPLVALNSELIATEVIRTLVGSIGLVLAVPMTTAIATWMLYGRVLGETASTRTHTH